MKNPGKERRLRRRIIIVFLCAIMLPSLFLAYLGLRYIKQELQRQEQLVLQGMQGTLSGVARKTESEIQKSIVTTIDSLVSLTSLNRTINPFKIYHFQSENPLLGEVFVLDNNERIIFPRTFRVQKEQGTVLTSLNGIARQWLIAGEESEARGKYVEAISNLTNGLNACVSTREKLAFQIRIARCRLKAGNMDGAAQSYRRILYEDGDRFFGEEVPYQIIAVFQLAQIMNNNGMPGESFDILAGLYEKMLLNFQLFEQQQFIYYLDKLHEELQRDLNQAGPSAPAMLDSLQRIEELFLKEPARSDFLGANIVPSVSISLRSRPELDIILYASVDQVADRPVYLAFRNLGSMNQGHRVIGASLIYNQLIAMVEKPLKAIELGDKLHAAILFGDSSSIRPVQIPGTIIATEPLSLLDGNLTGLKLAITGERGISLKEYNSRGVMLYYALIIIIILVIALGVTFIFHDMSRDQELTRMKSEFISNVTHEIKTPIATIRSLAENANEGWITSAEKHKEYFHLIASESEKLGHLVENTLDFSRIESGNKKYYMEKSSLKEVVEKTIERFRILTENQKIDLSCDLEKNLPPLYIDRSAIEQVLLNLFDNAAKYSPGEKIIRLTAKEEKDYLRLDISDKGIGIDKKDRSRIFDKFFRSEPGPGRHVTGSGIGLTLVKEIVESHGGSIAVESERNKGSTFTIRIPIKQKSHGKDIVD